MVRREYSKYTHRMSKRLQVIVDDAEYEALVAQAARRGESVSAWVRRKLRADPEESSDLRLARKLAAIRAAARFDGPTGAIDELLADNDLRYSTELPE